MALPIARSSRRRRGPAVIAAACACLLAVPPLAAHGPGDDGRAPSLAAAWTLDPLLVGGLLAATVLYGAGLVRLWRRAGIGHGIPRWRASAFASGLAACALALVWPLDALGEWSLAAHMGQHMLLMAVAASLLAAGLPGSVMLHALPAGAARRLGGIGAAVLSPTVHAAGLGLATALQGAAMVFWHLPGPLAAALANDGIHIAMHLSFLATGLLFWSAVLHSVRAPWLGFGAGALALVATMALMGMVGALLTFAPRPLYPYYLERAPALGLTPLADQQLAGLLMWVPSGLPYLAGAALLTTAWLRRVHRREAALDARLRGEGGDTT